MHQQLDLFKSLGYMHIPGIGMCFTSWMIAPLLLA